MNSISLLDRLFVPAGPIEIARDSSGLPTEFMPQSRYARASATALHNYGHGPFCKFRVRGLPSAPGVYLIADGGDPLYIGKAQNLRKRFVMGYGNISPKNCFVGGQQTNCRINAQVLKWALEGRDLFLYIHECDDYDGLETALLARYSTPWNRAR